jgi:hypothetical protein
VQYFTAWDPVFDPFQAEVDFGDPTGTIYRVVRLTGSVLPGIQDNVIRTNSSDTIVIALSSMPELSIADFDPGDVRAGPAKASPSNWYEHDLYGDGELDLFVEFKAGNLGIARDDDVLEIEVVDRSGQIKGRAYDEIIPPDLRAGPAIPRTRQLIRSELPFRPRHRARDFFYPGRRQFLWLNVRKVEALARVRLSTSLALDARRETGHSAPNPFQVA